MTWCLILRLQEISTHAPARGATHDKCLSLFYQMISTHAPARGATGAGAVHKPSR